MNGGEFVRLVRKLARKRGVLLRFESKRGKGGHQTLHYGRRHTVVKTGEISKGLLLAMLRQLGLDPKYF